MAWLDVGASNAVSPSFLESTSTPVQPIRARMYLSVFLPPDAYIIG